MTLFRPEYSSSSAISTGILGTRKLAAMVAALGLALVFTCHAELAFQILHEFSSTDGGPWEPWEIVLSQDGAFYASSQAGGSNNVGTIFRLTPAGVVTTLFTFGGAAGEYPQEGLTAGVDGNFYGTTYQSGGSANGSIFSFTTEGAFTNLHRFSCLQGEGIGPICRLTQTPDGTVYGTTFYGGSSGCFGNSAGTVFKLTKDGLFTTMVSFDFTNGGNPQCGLILGPEGALYGSTTDGGGPSGNAFGTIFKLTTNGLLTTLHTFDSLTDGSRPSGNLLLASDGNFYGTTEYGVNNSHGAIFKMTPEGALTTLVNFGGTNGSYPHGDLVQADDGYIYGRTIVGGAHDAGTLFRLTTNGTFTSFLSFSLTNGSGAWPALVLGADHNLYGATTGGGSADGGVAFRLAPLPQITSFGRSNDSITLTWASFTNGAYGLEQSTNLAVNGWTSIPPIVTANSSATTLVLPLQTNRQCFYRLALLP